MKMKQGNNELNSDAAKDAQDLKEQLEILSKMEFLVKSGAVKHLSWRQSMQKRKQL
jgi:hypothetical protein